MNYVPYWLQPVVRSVFKVYVNRADRKQLENLARLAEERSGLRPVAQNSSVQFSQTKSFARWL